MATPTASRQAAESPSGGKMARPRREAVRRTPYDRHNLPNSRSGNPSWFSKFVFSPSRKIATGAGKLLSSVFITSSSSSSLASSSDADSISEYDNYDSSNDLDISPKGTDNLKEMNGTLGQIQHLGKEPQPREHSSEIKNLIEELLMHETFSREECDKLISIIKSRVVDHIVIEDMRRVDNDKGLPDISSTAVMEAKKWIEEKKLASNSKSELDPGTHALSPFKLPNVDQGEIGSPADLAKLFMQARSPWLSPVGYNSTSPVGLNRLKEETLYSGGGKSASSSKKRDFLATGPWNLQDEIRRVRAKATEEMLRTSPSAKIDWSELPFGLKNDCNSLEKIETGLGDNVNNSSNPTEVTASHGFQVLQNNQNGSEADAATANPSNVARQLNQESEASENVKGNRGFCDGSDEVLHSGQRLHRSDVEAATLRDGGDADASGLKDNSGLNQRPTSVTGGTIEDSHEKDTSAPNLIAGTRDAITANSASYLGSSLAGHQDTEQNHREPDQHHSSIGGIHDDPSVSVEPCELLGEGSVEVPQANEEDTIASGSQKSSRGHVEEPLPELVKPVSKVKSAGEARRVARPQRKKAGGYNTRGKARGK